MNIREAILAAASHIERNPEALEFFAGGIPTDLECQACHVAWVCYFTGLRAGSVQSEVGDRDSPVGFGYLDLSDFADSHGFDVARGQRDSWTQDPVIAARLLRMYADERLPGAALSQTAAPAGEVRS